MIQDVKKSLKCIKQIGIKTSSLVNFYVKFGFLKNYAETFVLKDKNFYKSQCNCSTVLF